MKRNIILILVLAATLTASAQNWEQTDPNIRVYMEIDSDIITNLQLGLCFENKTALPMTAIGCDLDLPAGMSVYSYQRGEILNTGHWLSVKKYQNNYANRWFATCYCHYTQENSNVNLKQFLSDGRVATLTLDASSLSDGTYTIIVRNAEVLWTDGYSVKSFKTADFSLQIQLKEGELVPPVPTDIKGVEDKDYSPVVAGPQGIYTLQGVKVEKTQPGNIYIIDGKKVMVK